MKRTKVCSKCQEEKSEDSFYVDKRRGSLRPACKMCLSKQDLAWKKRNPEAAKQHNKDWRQRNPEKPRQYAKNDYYKNYERHKEEAKRFRKANPEKVRKWKAQWRNRNREKVRQKSSKWAANNPRKGREKSARYYARKVGAIPKWASKSEIRRIYEECPSGYEVDHIYPIKGEQVCGLHVPENLQYLTPSENYSKGNKMPEDHETSWPISSAG